MILPRKSCLVKPSIHTLYMPYWLSLVLIYDAHFERHDILGKSHIKWRQRSDMTIAVDWDVKHQLIQKQN